MPAIPTMTIRAFILLIPAICLALSLPSEAEADGKLKLFEQSAVAHTNSSSTSQASMNFHNYDPTSLSIHDNFCHVFAELCAIGFILTAAGAVYGGIASMDYAVGTGVTNIADDGTREFGESVVPFLRLDVSRGYIPDNISAVDARAEAGVGPFAFEVQETVYRENSPENSLYIYKAHGLYRMLFIPEIEADIGLGAVVINGIEVNKGHSFSARLLVYPVKNVGIEVRPVWYTINSNHTAECDVSVNAGLGYVMLRAGYRWMTTTTKPLNGYFVGVSAVF